MTVTNTTEIPTELGFRQAVMVYDLDAKRVSYDVADATIYYRLPANLPAHEVMDLTRAAVPPQIGVALSRDFPVLRHLRDLAEQSHREHDAYAEIGRLRRLVYLLFALVGAKTIALLAMGEAYIW